MFNTEQGGRFTCLIFTPVLQERGVKISMHGKEQYQDIIFVERLRRTVKYEEVYLKAYASVLEAQRGRKTISGSTTGLGPSRRAGLPDLSRGVPRGAGCFRKGL